MLGVAVLVLVFVIVFLRQEPTLQSAAADLGSCIADGDEACVARYVSDAEQDAVHLKGQKLEEAVGIALSFCTGSAVKELTPDDPSGEFYGRGLFTLVLESSERQVAIPLDLAYTDSGVRGTNLLTTLLNMKWRNDPRPVDAKSRGGAIMSRILRGIQEDRFKLEPLGMAGVLYKGKAMTFSEYEQYCAKEIAYAESLAITTP
jgi:hypothetical protein